MSKSKRGQPVEAQDQESNTRLPDCPTRYNCKNNHWKVLRSCELLKRFKIGSTVSQVVRLIGLLLVFASQKIVHKARNEMAESIVLRKKIKDSLTRQGMWNIRGLHKKRIGRKGRKGKSAFF